MPQCSLSAAQLVRYLQGVKNVAFATVTAKGEPRVAPIGSLFFRGCFYIPTVATAVRSKHVMRRPSMSLTHFVGDDLAIIVHGRATVVSRDDAEFGALEELQRASSGVSVREWGEGVYLRVEAEVIYTFARNPAVYAG
jgi:uncharacterized pyridoxamine 5'-phosphate oxidase family protein